jgi:hypothetical protein
MKKLVSCFFFFLIFSNCFGQRYEIWIESSESNKRIKGNYALSNDSTLMLYSNPSLLFPTKDKYFTWDEVENLKIRNKTKNQLGILIGAGAGWLTFELLKNSISNTADREVVEFTSILTIPIFVGTGALIGYLATSKKKKVPVHGLDSTNKNKVLKSYLKRKKK